jgi:cellulose synthase/poly-beta-1,6-N-acetylglucosamine synthase-like glycosyltransferase
MRSGFDVPPQQDLKLTVVIPVYNERETLPRILRAVALALPGVTREVVLIDDCSTDGTREWIEATFTSSTTMVSGVRRSDSGQIEFRRRLGGLFRPRHGQLDGVELGLALDREQRDLAAAARLAFERPPVERRPVGFGRLQQAEGD